MKYSGTDVNGMQGSARIFFHGDDKMVTTNSLHEHEHSNDRKKEAEKKNKNQEQDLTMACEFGVTQEE
ncbi:hypothetical protein DEO72_LG8g1347 [Vigna unguiculata]|uniref:Uncharacterized protein n=1 Tax=Vigna unguiculata TaxID=3917 RepID=A0A4D6MPK9_VIGUN|nr:hypothetical protein DEO72_LG8g1347 [Vigna unguiculata]